jgi:signal transduction histidine kinase
LRHDVRRTVTEVRETLHDLHTDVSEETSLVAVLERFLERVEGRTGTAITFTHEAPARLPLRQEREMWRIAQEAITNAERHADARHIHVRWNCNARGALLEVTDDGKGVPPGGPAGEGYGLLGMRERAEAIGATFEVGPGEGAGTVVRCRLEPRD